MYTPIQELSDMLIELGKTMNMQQWERLSISFSDSGRQFWRLFLSGPSLGNVFIEEDVMRAFVSFVGISPISHCAASFEYPFLFEEPPTL